ncbi:Aminomethyltransferase folate-binding domain/Glycine cleavage T-protein C-terminal barrel domain containing protein, putative [Leishmania donovani]|uniref:Aminomethyltransferase folate-binding domain/Glycine cleavage T-protein C-terminal barrel domain containing protein, putative n=1 Tax=Leishmania donovani TaxID=5661 RepID=A0A3Q8IEZ2_LEIDO|nr:Aminomethyltransferase folate-binding domain/Glycine cleavage T-protein C-terminal barrel domain containing protein, putative [Leishmania donovani]
MKPLVPFVCRLPSRRILRVRGTDVHEFLQGIFTNDLRELHPAGSMYGCFLYFTGRVLCDAHLYQCKQVHEGQASILVDVHERSAAGLFDHLTEMKMRKKVHIDDVGKELVVLATLEETFADAQRSSDSASGCDARASSVTPLSPETLEERHTECFPDPRNDALFTRPPPPSSSSSTSASDSVDTAAASATAAPPSSSPPAAVTPPSWFLRRCVVPATWAPPFSSPDPYTTLLYSRGIGEGPDVFKHNKSLPFEGNLDFLKGVSFHKGCYVGQELTHRTHVMLVTRKRTVPLHFGPASVDPPAAGAITDEGTVTKTRPVEVGEPLYSAAKEKIGEVTGVCGQVGIGLFRLRYVDKATRTVPGLQLKDGTPVQSHLPDWWPRKEVKKLLKNNS